MFFLEPFLVACEEPREGLWPGQRASHKNYLIPGTSCEEGKTSCFAWLVPALSIFDLINFQSLINLNFIGGYFIDT